MLKSSKKGGLIEFNLPNLIILLVIFAFLAYVIYEVIKFLQ